MDDILDFISVIEFLGKFVCLDFKSGNLIVFILYVLEEKFVLEKLLERELV